MRTVRTKVYKFNELTEAAKEKAIEQHRNQGIDYGWHAENRQTLEAFADLLPISISNRRFDNISFSIHGDIEDLKGFRLASYLWNNYGSDIFKPKQYWICNGHKNCVGLDAKKRESKIFFTWDNCPLTGYCMDCAILEPLAKFMLRPDLNTTFEDIASDCLNAWSSACERDIEDANSDRAIAEEIEANEYEFQADGTRF